MACELRESAHVTLMEAHSVEGNVVEAVRQFPIYERLPAVELGIEPSPRIRAVLPPVRHR